MPVFDPLVAFTAVVALIALLRLAEIRVARRNAERLVAAGAFEVGRSHYPWMVALHTLFLVSCVAEVWLFDRPWIPAVSAVAFVVLGLALALRWWTLETLGDRWTTRVFVLPGEELVSGGPYRLLRHPNYLAVVLEIAAIPMLHFAWVTAVVFSIANLALLRVRIGVEEDALASATSGGAETDRRLA
ncbi:MAG: isoprenylcysteine carboxylmethyltransferase family protein [Holophagae bacterium]|jgi:methyltransferase